MEDEGDRRRRRKQRGRVVTDPDAYDLAAQLVTCARELADEIGGADHLTARTSGGLDAVDRGVGISFPAELRCLARRRGPADRDE